MVVDTLIVCVTIDCNEEDWVTRIRKITNLEKIIIAVLKNKNVIEKTNCIIISKV